ncbi:methionine aminopeptidase [Tepiditoga spiralis]|uniref:Methionine aminopeptidase n=1 Tax=Tepiditoga spiralis TaxID=2108365 RepID=A0A7G1G3C6_9BACT|nr:type I methionyl aminopeptidase [Tepiditoga spiralis]BBE30918.1 methionine aminopeptidase [Tepiditoga spiralis]
MIIIKTEKEIEMMRRAGAKLARLLDDLILGVIKDGASAYDVEMFVLDYMKKINVIPTFKGYADFPYATCISVNEEVIHGFALKEKVFKNGDLVSIDCGLTYEGYIADSARTFIIGDVSEKEKKLVEVTKKSLYLGIEQAVPGNRIGDIGNAVQKYVEQHGFSVIRDFVGHGVGRKLHEDPQVPNFGRPNSGALLRKNMTIAIEPMVAMGNYEVEVLDDGWTTVTKDRSKAAHFEHSIVITENGPEILTSLNP